MGKGLTNNYLFILEREKIIYKYNGEINKEWWKTSLLKYKKYVFLVKFSPKYEETNENALTVV